MPMRRARGWWSSVLLLAACGGDPASPDAPPGPAIDATVYDAPLPPVTSIRIGDGARLEAFAAVAIAPDGTVFAAGSAEGGAGGTDGFAAIFDTSDHLAHARAYGTAQGDGFTGAAIDRTGAGAVLVGGTGDAQQLGVAAHVGKDLGIFAARAFGGSARSGSSINQGGQVLNAIALVNSGFVAAGETYPTTAAAEGASWILAIDDQLITRWDRALDDSVNRTGAHAVAASGARALIGSYAHPTATTTVLRISAFDDQGATVTSAWVRQPDQLLPGTGVIERVTAIARTTAGDAWVTGNSALGSDSAGQILKLDASGAVIAAARLEDAGHPILHAVVATADGGCVVAGEAGDHGLVAKLDASGAISWQQAIGTTGTSRITAAAAAPDGSMVLVGAHSGDAWFVRLPTVAMAPKDFGTAAATTAVAETPGMTTPIAHAAAWNSVGQDWMPTETDLASLPVTAAP